MTGPQVRHKERFTAGNTERAPDGRFLHDTAYRNAPPLIAALTPWLSGRRGTVLEIGSGTGQHAGAMALAFPDLTWQPSDPDPEHRASIAAWARYLRLDAAPAPLDLDAAGDWAAGLGSSLAGVTAFNVIHIAPPAVLDGIVAGAGKALAPGGLLIFYGPFTIRGRHVGPGNASFDAGLRAANPDWGLRDVAEVEEKAEAAGLSFAALRTMPANNRLLILQRPSRPA